MTTLCGAPVEGDLNLTWLSHRVVCPEEHQLSLLVR